MDARQALFIFGQRARAAGVRLESREQRVVRLHRERLTACFAGIRAARLRGSEGLVRCVPAPPRAMQGSLPRAVILAVVLAARVRDIIRNRSYPWVEADCKARIEAAVAAEMASELGGETL